jgi:hypothetical protein
MVGRSGRGSSPTACGIGVCAKGDPARATFAYGEVRLFRDFERGAGGSRGIVNGRGRAGELGGRRGRREGDRRGRSRSAHLATERVGG